MGQPSKRTSASLRVGTGWGGEPYTHPHPELRPPFYPALSPHGDQRPWECAKGSNVVNPKAGGTRVETWSPTAQRCQQGVPGAGGWGPCPGGPPTTAAGVRSQVKSLEASGSFPCLIHASHGSTIMWGSLWGGPEPQAMVLSALPDLKSWQGWSEEPGKCLDKKETKQASS